MYKLFRKGRLILGLAMLSLALIAPTFNVNAGTLEKKTKPLISSTFIQYWMCEDWDEARWTQELNMLKEIGINEVILQYTANIKDKYATYPTKLEGYTANDIDMVGTVLKASDNLKMQVRIGLAYSDDWWGKGVSDLEWLNSEAEANKALIDELSEMYGKHSSFTGWYIPYEFSQFTVLTKPYQLELNKFFKQLCDEIKLKKDKDIMIAPFYNFKFSWVCPIWNWGNVLETVLADTGISTLALQDSVGAGYNTVTQAVTLFYYSKLATDSLGIKLYADTETFAVGSTGFIPAPQDRISTQLEAELPFVEGFTAFSINHYQNKYSSDSVQVNGYNDYLNYYLNKK